MSTQIGLQALWDGIALDIHVSPESAQWGFDVRDADLSIYSRAGGAKMFYRYSGIKKMKSRVLD